MAAHGNSTDKKMRPITAIAILASLTAFSCKGPQASAPAKGNESAMAATPAFNGDSAYMYVRSQTDFGPRVPGTKAHSQCADWMAGKFRSFGLETIVQPINVATFDGTVINGWNIIGQVNPEASARIIVCSHWDSRPWADNDPDPANHKTPVDGADDGASGVGVIMEMARVMQESAPAIGVDFILFDAEDWGPGDDYTGRHLEEYWALGTQFWARNPHKPGYKARYAVLLDMVGGKGARFCKEGVSVHFAKGTVDKIWDTAAKLGFGSLFPALDGGFVTDDHYFINTIAKIPAVDIIPYRPDSKGSSFGPNWHTTTDNIDNIDKRVLEAVGKVMLQVIYNEKP